MHLPLLFALLFSFADAQWEPAQLAAEMQKNKPFIVYVGFPVLYKGAHIEGAVLAGPASKPAGLEALASALKDVSKDRTVVLYCGCCPWDKCPNIRPAYDWLASQGYTKARVVHIATNLHTDWVTQGYPTEKLSH